MPLFGNQDLANNAPTYAVLSGLGSSANSTQLYANTTLSAYVTGIKTGIFAVDASEKANTASNNQGGIVTHTGWNLRIEGSGGRAGRINYETLVAGGIESDNTLDDTILIP